MIKVSDLHKSFGKLEVLKGIDENIEKGEKIVVIGPSGSGKSTFLRCLNLLETPTSGQIWFDGQCITDKKTDINRVRRSMGMVFQHFNLFNNKTVLGNITLAPIQLKLMNKEEANENALRLLDRIGLRDKADAYPSMLSGGQKQRVAIAGILAMEPQILIFDEASAMLDPRGRRGLMRVCKELHAQGMTIIMITHYMEEAAEADRVLVLREGKIVLDGTPEEVLTQDAELRKLNLDIPFATQLSRLLQDKGIDIPTFVDREPLKEALWLLYSNTSATPTRL